MQLYTDDYNDTFPAHRNQNVNNADEVISLTNWWGTTIIGYARNQSNLFRCAAIKGKRLDNGLRVGMEVRLPQGRLRHQLVVPQSVALHRRRASRSAASGSIPGPGSSAPRS